MTRTGRPCDQKHDLPIVKPKRKTSLIYPAPLMRMVFVPDGEFLGW